MTTVAAETMAENLPSPALATSTKRQDTSATAASTGSDEPQGENDNDSRSDEEILIEATQLCKDDKLLPGIKVFRKVKDTSLYTDEQKQFIHKAEIMEKLRADLLAPPSDGWSKQGESHGSRDFIVYYKVEDGGKLRCRIESVIEASLYIPFLAVCNETDLYDTWFPKWRFPFTLGMNRSEKLKQTGRCEQVVQLAIDMPFPLNNREIVFWGYADDDTEKDRKAGAKLLSVDEGFQGVVPPPEKGIVRMDLEAEFLFRPCPDDHEALKNSKAKYPEGERLILLTFVCNCDPKIYLVPHAFMNFCTRTAMGTVWRMILRIAEEVRAGERPAHSELIASKREELYDWIEKQSEFITGLKSSKRKGSPEKDEVE
jgi:hypothetical protein